MDQTPRPIAMSQPQTLPRVPQQPPRECPAPLLAPDAAPRQKVDRLPRWAVVLHNTNDHSIVFVMRMLQAIFSLDQAKAERITLRAHRAGLAVVEVTTRDRAELKVAQVAAYGPDPGLARSTYPVPCTIEGMAG